MARLVKIELAATGELHCADETPADVLNRLRELDPFVLQRLNRRRNVVAHEVELVTTLQRVAARPGVFLGGMDTQFGRRQCEDEPALPGIDPLQPEHVPEESAVCLSILCVDHDMSCIDHRSAPRSVQNRCL